MTDDVKQAAEPARPKRGGGPERVRLRRAQRLAERQHNSSEDEQSAEAVVRKIPVGVIANAGGAKASPRRLEQRLSVVAPNRLPKRDTDPLAPIPFLGAIPESETRRSYSIYIWFAACVVLPTILASLYFGLVASNQYAAEFRFTVQDNSLTATTTAATGLMSMLGAGGNPSSTNNYMVTDYLASQQAVEELQKRINVVSLYSKPEIDWWSRFIAPQPIERFVDYWKTKVTAQYDLVTGIATAQVLAFSPQDALNITNTLVKMSEELINKIANRSQQDAVRFAEQEVNNAQDRLRRVRAQLTEYRNKFGIIDPTTSVAASNSSLIQNQRALLAQLETQLSTLQSQHLAPNAPAVVTLKIQVKSIKEQLARTEADVARGNNGSALSAIVGDFEKLNLEVQFAQAMVTSTMQALDQARANATAQHLYITPYVRPALPESSTYPRRYLAVAAVAALAFAFWLSGLMIVKSIRERFG